MNYGKLILVGMAIVFMGKKSMAAEPYASCKSINESGYELVFSKLTSHRIDWCEEGIGSFQILQNGKLFLSTQTTWDSCSKSGTSAEAEVDGISITFRDHGGSSWLAKPNGLMIEFKCK